LQSLLPGEELLPRTVRWTDTTPIVPCPEAYDPTLPSVVRSGDSWLTAGDRFAVNDHSISESIRVPNGFSVHNALRRAGHDTTGRRAYSDLPTLSRPAEVQMEERRELMSPLSKAEQSAYFLGELAVNGKFAESIQLTSKCSKCKSGALERLALVKDTVDVFPCSKSGISTAYIVCANCKKFEKVDQWDLLLCMLKKEIQTCISANIF
jgi:hypothetical protein